MSGTTPTATYTLTDFNSQNPTPYKSNIDGNFAVAQRIVDPFAPHAQVSPNMTVQLDPGSIWSGSVLTELSAQNTSVIVAPVTNPRIDRVVISSITGIIAVITGTEAMSPVAPAFGVNQFPVAQVALQTTSVIITNAMITDERNFAGTGVGVVSQNTYTTPGTATWTKPTSVGPNSLVYLQIWGAGGSGQSGSSNYGGGGGGSYKDGWFPLSTFSATETITIAAGGASVTGTTVGNGGAASSFGTHLIAYGGSGGGTTGNGNGGGAGGWFSNTTTEFPDVPTTEGKGGDYNGGAGALPLSGYYTGGGGGIGNLSPIIQNAGAKSVYGGGGGGCGANAAGGTSIIGGAGGAGSSSGNATAGVQPSGGGGGCKNTGFNTGKGGDGKIVVTVFNG